jgi:predicted ATP-dependent Lon-type protease
VKNSQLQEQITQNHEILQKEQTKLRNLVTQNHLTSQEEQDKLSNKVDKNHVEIMNILQNFVNSKNDVVRNKILQMLQSSRARITHQTHK